MIRRLIVNADDYGKAPLISAGIRRAHLEGIVTSTTAMMNQPGVAEALEAALRECPQLGLGVHLVLTAGKPLRPKSEVPSLVALGILDGFPNRNALLAGVTTLNLAEVEAEWRAQIGKFIAITGRAPTHLDSHHHASYFTPALFSLMLDLAREYGVGIRMPVVDASVAAAVLGEPVDSPQVAAQLDALRSLLQSKAARRVPMPDTFEPRFYGEGVSAERLNGILAHLPAGVTEIMCHPSLDGPELASLSVYNAPRVRELAALTQPGLRQRLAKLGITLISFAALSPRG